MSNRCSHCGAVRGLGGAVAGKFLGMTGGAMVAPVVYRATGSKVLAAVAGFAGSSLGTLAGHALVDAAASAVCPQCGRS